MWRLCPPSLNLLPLVVLLLLLAHERLPAETADAVEVVPSAALLLDDECTAPAEVCGAWAAAAASDLAHGGCALSALQVRASARNGASAADALASGHRWSEAEQEALDFARGWVDGDLGATQLHPQDALSSVSRHMDPFGQMFQTMLTSKLDAVNRKLDAAIPTVINDVYSSKTAEKHCCIKSPWSCWCHCEAKGEVEVTKLTNASTLKIEKVVNVTTDTSTLGLVGVTIFADLHAKDLTCSGWASKKVDACGMNLPKLVGGLSIEVSVQGLAELKGTFGSTTSGKMCFKFASVKFFIPAEGVTYERNAVSIGDWQILTLSGDFWNTAVHQLPTQPLIDSLADAAEKVLPSALENVDMCL